MSVRYIESLSCWEEGEREREIQIEQVTDKAEEGSVVWDCALVLIGYLSRPENVNLLRNKCVLDIGSGTGIAGIAASVLYGAKSVLLTDRASQLDLLQRNITRNAAQGVSVRELVWEDAAHIHDVATSGEGSGFGLGPAVSPFDWIIASDCVYGDKSSLPLVHVLLTLLDQHLSAQVLIVFEQRPPHPAAQGVDFSGQFFAELREQGQQRGLALEAVSADNLGDMRCDEISLYHMYRRA